MTFLDHLARTRSIGRARREHMRERRWTAEDWYRAWQTTALPMEVTSAVETYVSVRFAGVAKP